MTDYIVLELALAVGLAALLAITWDLNRRVARLTRLVRVLYNHISPDLIEGYGLADDVRAIRKENP